MFKDNLKNLRKMKNLSQQDLAKILNVSFKTISHWEMGYTEPSIALLIKIKDALAVSFEELLE